MRALHTTMGIQQVSPRASDIWQSIQGQHRHTFRPETWNSH